MPEIKIRDTFYPGISIHRTLRRSPSSVVAIHEQLLKANGFRTNTSDLKVALSASRGLHTFLSKEARGEVNEYASQPSQKGRPIRGPVVVQFDLVVQIMSQILEYARDHPRESLETAAAFAVLGDYLERKLGRIVGAIWRKISDRASNSTPKREIIHLLQIERVVETSKRKRKSKKSGAKKRR